ncbi:MAG TPA: FMN-binding protein [Nocardioidaceae bacterium]|nr:FMN-binding protein [Nocardioidaceae bacterium]
MKRITFWFLSTLSTLVLLFGYHTSTSGSLAAGSSSSPSAVVSGAAGTPKTGTGSSSAAAGSGSGGSGSGDGSSGSGSTSSGSSSGSATSTVTGSVVDTQWGPVQVQFTRTGDAITAVNVLQYPSGNPKDDEINAQALPILIDETKQSGSAQIDMVSGATVTSTGYIESLQSALDKAGA